MGDINGMGDDIDGWPYRWVTIYLGVLIDAWPYTWVTISVGDHINV